MSMTKDSLRQLVQKEPFQPLTIHMVDGKTVTVPHPDHLFFAPHSDTIFVVAYESGIEKFRFLTPDKIASVELGS